MTRPSKIRVQLLVSVFVVVSGLVLLAHFTMIQTSPETIFIQQFALGQHSQLVPTSDLPISSLISTVSHKFKWGTALSGQPLHFTSLLVNDSDKNGTPNNSTKGSSQSSKPSTAAISVGTDHSSYTGGANVRIDGSSLPNSMVKLQINRTHENMQNITYQSFPLTSANGHFGANLTINEPGQYQVVAVGNVSGEATNAKAMNAKAMNRNTAISKFEVIDIWSTTSARIFYIMVAFFIALLVVIYLESLRDDVDQDPFQTPYVRRGGALEVTRFFLITGITFAFIGNLLFADTELGATSTLGIVRQHGPGAQNQTQWVANLGGIPKNGFYQGGIQIPVLVIILGTLGGYLRYLYGLKYLFATQKEAKIRQNVDPEWFDIDVSEKSAMFKHSIRSLGLIFLSPLLAIGTWFLLTEAGLRSPLTLAVVSLTVGLITDEIIRTLIQFARNILGTIKGPSQQQPESKGPLAVSSKSPSPGSGDVPIHPIITAEFTDPIDKTTVNTHSFRLANTTDINKIMPINQGTKVDVSPDGRTATLTPPTLEIFKDYTATITTEVKDLNGNGLEADEKWSFKTAKYDHNVKVEASSDYGPALVNGNGHVLLAWIGKDTNKINFMESSDGFSFSKVDISEHSSQNSVALAFFKEKYIVAWTEDNHINVMQRGDAQVTPVADKVQTSSVPSLAVLEDKIYLCWQAQSDNQLYIKSSTDGKTWTTDTVPVNETAFFQQSKPSEPKDISSAGPSIVASGSYLYLSWIGTDNRLNVKSSKDGISFSNKVPLDETSKSRPTLAVYENKIYLCWLGLEDKLINILHSDESKGPPLDEPKWSKHKIFLNSEGSIDTPSISNIGEHIVIGWTGTDKDHSLNVDNRKPDFSFYFYKGVTGK